MYNTNNSNTNYNRTYQEFVSQSMQRLKAHFGNYGGAGGYQSKPVQRNTDYDLFK
jgi:hypothetical protein